MKQLASAPEINIDGKVYLIPSEKVATPNLTVLILIF